MGLQYTHNNNLRQDSVFRMNEALKEADWTYARDAESKTNGWVMPNGEGFMDTDGAYNVLLGIGEVVDLRPEYRKRTNAFREDFCSIMSAYSKTGC